MEENKHPTAKLFVGLFITVTVLVVGGFFANKYLTPKPEVTEKTPEENKSNTEEKVVTLPSSEYPNRIPKDLPFPAGSKLEQNYSKGNVQSTRAVVTTENVSKLFESFKKFGKDNGWTEKTSVEQGNFRLLLLEKSRQLMQVDFSTNNETKQTTVTVTVTPLP